MSDGLLLWSYTIYAVSCFAIMFLGVGYAVLAILYLTYPKRFMGLILFANINPLKTLTDSHKWRNLDKKLGEQVPCANSLLRYVPREMP